MFDFFRDRESTAEDKNLEALYAYLDNTMPPAERERLENRLARETNLRAELEQLRVMKYQMRAMPRRRVPRSFTLDPATYARPKAQPLLQLYPVLRGATALTAFLLIFTLALGAFRGQFSAGGGAAETAAVLSEVIITEEAAAPIEVPQTFSFEEPSAERDSTSEKTAEPAAGAMEESAEINLTAQATITAGIGVAAIPAPAATALPDEESLAQQAPASEEMAELTVEEPAAIDESSESDTGLVVANEADQFEAETDNTSILLPLQIGLGALFAFCLILWLLARRRARSL